jgi:hypothetical protein
MESEGSSPHSQEPATCSYPEADRSNLRPINQILEDLFKYFLSIYAWIL